MWVAFLLVVVRPQGDTVLLTASGGTQAGAFTLGLLLTLLPIVTASGFGLATRRGRAAGHEWTPSPRHNALMYASLAPISGFPFLSSRSGFHTPFELSPLYDAFLLGFVVGFAPLVVLGLVLIVVRSARRALRHLEAAAEARTSRGPRLAAPVTAAERPATR